MAVMALDPPCTLPRGNRGVGGQAIGQHAPRRPGPDHNEVEVPTRRLCHAGEQRGSAYYLDEVASVHSFAISVSSLPATRSRPSRTSISNSPGLTIRPVMARRVP